MSGMQSQALPGKPPLSTDIMPREHGALATISTTSFADNEQFLANINCSLLRLIPFIRDKAGLQNAETIDLCEENGALKLLFLVKFPEENASKFLTLRGTYYICRVERGAPGNKDENAYRAFYPVFKNPPLELIDSLHNQCDFLEKSRIKILRSQDGKKPPTLESLRSSMAGLVVGKSTGKAAVSGAGSTDKDGSPRKLTTTAKGRVEASGNTDEDASPHKLTGAAKARMEASKKEKHR